jgi:hypothetical protein
MTRTLAILAGVLLACAHKPTPEQQALMKRGDCAELLLAADAARAQGKSDLAADLAGACTPEGLDKLVHQATPAQALLWCGRAAAARHKGCETKQVAQLAGQLRPRISIGPADESMQPDPRLASALQQVGSELNLVWDQADPDVIVGKLEVDFDHVTSNTTTTVEDPKGGNRRVPAVLHRYLARAEAQVGLGGKTQVVRASEEARDLTWEGSVKPAAAKTSAPPAEEMKQRVVVAWFRALAKTIAAAPPEAVDVTDDKGCVAYGLSLNLASGDPGAAAKGAGDPAKIAACEKLLGEPAGAGIPVP